MNLKTIFNLEKRNATYDWACQGTFNILPVISHESAVFQIRHLMEWQNRLNMEWMIENENKRYEQGEWLPWLFSKGIDL